MGYAFCRAHSTAYGVEAYEAAHLKRYYAAEFLSCVLTHGKGFYSRLVYSLECRRLGIGYCLMSICPQMRIFPNEGLSAASALPPFNAGEPESHLSLCGISMCVCDRRQTK